MGRQFQRLFPLRHIGARPPFSENRCRIVHHLPAASLPPPVRELVRETALAACAWARERENSGGLLHVARHAPSRGAGEGGRAWRQAATPTPTAPFVSASEVIPFLPFKCADSRGGRAPMSPSPPSSHLWCVLSIPGNLCQKKGGSACMLFKIERFPLPPRRRRERCSLHHAGRVGQMLECFNKRNG